MNAENIRTMSTLRAGMAVLAMGLLLAACGGGGGNDGMAPVGDQPGAGGGPMTGGDQPGTGDGSMMSDIGDWNTPAAGTLDVSDANSMLRVHYTASTGPVITGTPVQPSGTGSATWSGGWSGKIDVSDDPLVRGGLVAIGITDADIADLATLDGGARVTVTFMSSGVEAVLTYEDVDVEELSITEISTDPFSVMGGEFAPTASVMETLDTVVGPVALSGDFSGAGVFAGTDAMGVAGHMSGNISFALGGGPSTSAGTFSSVFYGTKN